MFKRWKPWQYAFMGYLLLLNMIVMCALGSFTLRNDVSVWPVAAPQTQMAGPVDSPTSTRKASATVSQPAIEATVSPTAAQATIPPITIEPVPMPTVTAAPIAAVTPTATPPPTATPTATSSPTLTPAATATTPPTQTFTPSPTATRTPTPTPRPTSTFTATPSPTPTRRPTSTSSPTPIPIATSTPSPSPTRLPTRTPTSTPRSTAAAVAALTVPDEASSISSTADLIPAGAAQLVEAIPLTNDSIALSWLSAERAPYYHIYSDMGSGFGIYVYQDKTDQPAFIDDMLRPGMQYTYRLTRQADEQEQILGQTQSATFAGDTDFADTLKQDNATAHIPAPAPTALPADVVLLGLLSEHNFTDNFNVLTIAGEVRNDSPVSVGRSRITVTFYDLSGAVIGTAIGETMLDVIAPGQISPFLITLSRPPALSSYSVRAIAQPTNADSVPQLSVVEIKRFEDNAGFLHIKGQVSNVGATISKRTKVAAVLYGRDGRVINVGFTYVHPPNLVPGATADYEVVFSYYPRYFSQKVIPFEE